MKFWCKIWYISIEIKFQNKKKSLPTYPFFLVMIPEHNYFLFWPNYEHFCVDLSRSKMHEI